MERLIPLIGLFVLLAIAWAMSSNRHRISMRIVVGGILMQFVLALVVLRLPQGQQVFQWIGDLFTSLLECVDHGAGFVFGENAVSTPAGDTPAYKVHFVAFKVLPTIIFFSSLMSILYYLGVMQKIGRAHV